MRVVWMRVHTQTMHGSALPRRVGAFVVLVVVKETPARGNLKNG